MKANRENAFICVAGALENLAYAGSSEAEKAEIREVIGKATKEFKESIKEKASAKNERELLRNQVSQEKLVSLGRD